MKKNYICFMGGTFGDLTERILNNGFNLSNSLKESLKTDIITEEDKKNIISSKLNVICGHSFKVFNWDWNIEKYCIFIKDEEILDICAKRFYIICPDGFETTLAEYYPQKFLNKILKEEDRIRLYKILLKNFNKIQIEDCKKIYFDEIYNKKNYLKTLSEHFIFDNDKANLIYDEWFIKEQIILEKLGKSFN